MIAEVEAARPAAIVWSPLDFGRGGEGFGEWMRSCIDAHYRPHAAALVGADAVRGCTGSGRAKADSAWLADPSRWATIFVREDRS